MKKTKGKQRVVLLDAHAIIHRAYHALPDFSTSAGEATGGLYGVSAMLLKIAQDLKPDYIIACYDLPEPTFRHEAYKEYKKGRAKAEDDLVAQIIRSRDIFKAFNIPIYEHKGFEADDILGTIVEQLKGRKDIEIMIASGDMDTLQLVEGKRVSVYTLRKGLSDTVIYDENAVRDRFGFAPKLLADFKGLRGDPSDNIIGIAGIGEKTATMLIQEFGTIENIYKVIKKDSSTLAQKGVKERIIKLLIDGEEEAFFSKTLATIRRDAPVKFRMPESTWLSSVDIAKMEDLFHTLEFRSLIIRAKETLGVSVKEEEETEENTISPERVRRAGIALWVLRSDITNPDKEDILHYAKTNIFDEAEQKIFSELKESGLEGVYADIELPIIPIIQKAQDRGIRIDTTYVKKLSDRYHADLAKIEKTIWMEAGGEFNINSPKQMGEVLFDTLHISTKGLKKTAGGARSTRESELAKLKEAHPIVSEILKYRELQKLLSTYIDTIPDMIDGSKRLHTTLNQTGTTTGRFSSTNPNLQNIPIRGERGRDVRNMFVATSGHTFVAFDYSQIEMRILAVLSGDKILVETFQRGIDVHTSVAANVYGVPESAVTKDMRRAAKVINFGIIYGMGVNALKENLGSTRSEAQEFYNNYFERLPDVANYFEQVKKNAHANGYVETYFGRRRYFDGIRSPISYIRAAAERQAMNAPIQGTAADIIKMAMVKTEETIQKNNLARAAHLLLQIHDELLYEVEDDMVEQVKKLVTEAMESVVSFTVPLSVDVEEGGRWGDIE